MPVMNNDLIKKVVFYSTRQIHPFYPDKDDLTPSDSLIKYFSGLKKDEKTKDEFSKWLSDLAFLHDFRQELKAIVRNMDQDECIKSKEKLKDVISIFDRFKKDGNPHEIIDKIATFLDESHEEWHFGQLAYEAFLNMEEEDICFRPCHFKTYRNHVLSCEATHLNTGDNSSSEIKGTKLKHRLGVYHKEEEEGEYAVAAVWPWPKGDNLEPNHDENWKKAIVEAIKELYPNTDEITLVIHDWDLDEWKDKDQIVFRRRPLSRIKDSNYDEECLPNKDDPRISLIVFQHTNRNVITPLIKDKENRLNSPKQVWEAIERYLKRDILRKKDEEKEVEAKHNKAID